MINMLGKKRIFAFVINELITEAVDDFRTEKDISIKDEFKVCWGAQGFSFDASFLPFFADSERASLLLFLTGRCPRTATRSSRNLRRAVRWPSTSPSR